ncbi:Hypothetical predicted protein [Olea europaea subsp. europaea]|uniref:Uncharacterized protein n=1 Tax=Olea europaea subsp. europaea TaxID=158383 RepID=A0A8S0RD66_OLEEU|nr:Hypothetical predicted protein [Olea europaea subsp. europaea]
MVAKRMGSPHPKEAVNQADDKSLALEVGLHLLRRARGVVQEPSEAVPGHGEAVQGRSAVAHDPSSEVDLETAVDGIVTGDHREEVNRGVAIEETDLAVERGEIETDVTRIEETGGSDH